MSYKDRGPIPAPCRAAWDNKRLKEFWEAVAEVEPPSLRVRIVSGILRGAQKQFLPEGRATEPDASGVSLDEIYRITVRVLAQLRPHIEEMLKNENRKD